MANPITKSKQSKTIHEFQRFRDMAQEVGADESPGALDRAFGKLDPKKPNKTAAKPKRP